MREILFRGKRKDNGEWVDGSLQCFKGVSIFDRDIKNFVVVHPETVGQYTGLTDKNGKKIFEGDIVNCKTRNYKFVSFAVEWYQRDCRYTIGRGKNGELQNYVMSSDFEYEIIGNIHDNPELLEVDNGKID